MQPRLWGFFQIKNQVLQISHSLTYLELHILSKLDNFGDLTEIFAKTKKREFSSFLLYPKITIKIVKNRPILMKLTFPNRQDFAIFKTPRFFKFGQILFVVGSDLQIFGKLKSYVHMCFKKWTLILCIRNWVWILHLVLHIKTLCLESFILAKRDHISKREGYS